MAQRRAYTKSKQPSEYESKVIEIRRVSRVVQGGRRFSFRATVVAGNRMGKVGIGVAKGQDVSQAVEKATRLATKGVANIPLSKVYGIPHEVEGKFSAAYIRIKPTRAGRGIIAGGAARFVLALAGFKDATAKILSRSGNKLNVARATLEALKKLTPTQKARDFNPSVGVTKNQTENMKAEKIISPQGDT